MTARKDVLLIRIGNENLIEITRAVGGASVAALCATVKDVGLDDDLNHLALRSGVLFVCLHGCNCLFVEHKYSGNDRLRARKSYRLRMQSGQQNPNLLNIR